MAAASKAKPRHIFDFHIDVGQMLDRPRVNRLFADSLACPLTAVHAPSGYGKTTAVLQFVQQAQARSIYLSLNDLDKDLPYFWERLAALYARLEPPAGAKLLQLGFPASDSAFAAFAGICKDLTVKEKLLLIIDDFHVADCPDLENWLIKVARLRLKNFHIFILSRNQPSVCGLDLRVKRLVSEITKEHLRFILPEILAYYALNHIDINETAAQAIDNFTEGWASAIYLSSLYYTHSPDKMHHIAALDIDRLIETTVYQVYSEEIRYVLLQLSILDNFDVDLCSYLTGKKNMHELLSRMVSENSLIKISADKQMFALHRLFRDFLQARLSAHPVLEKNDLHSKAAAYYEYKNNILMALHHLDQAGDYEQIAALILRNKCASTFSNQEITSILYYMEKLPQEYFRRQPMLTLILAMSLTRTKHAPKSLKLLADIEQLCANPAMPDEERSRLLGEAAVIRALMSFNNASLMLPYFKAASRFLPEGSCLLSEHSSFTFGSPSILYLYYRQPGEMDTTLEIFREGFPYWEKVSSCGYGGDCLLRAETAFERGDYTAAEQDAFRALYRAEEKRQNSIVIAAKLLLIKLCALKGKYRAAAILLKDMCELMNYRKALMYLSTLDMCTAIFHLLCGNSQAIPRWLTDGNLTVSAANRAGFGMEFIIYGQILLIKGDYLKLEAILPRMFETYSLFTNQYGICRAHIMAAATGYHLYGLEPALPSLQAACAITAPDRMIMPYLEYGEYLLPILQEVIRQDCAPSGISRQWLEETIKKIKTHMAGLEKFKTGFHAAHPEAAADIVKLTRREAEILGLIAEGLSSEKIAARLHVTPINVRVITSKLYDKLGVRSRVEAVRTAIDNGLIK